MALLYSPHMDSFELEVAEDAQIFKTLLPKKIGLNRMA